MHDIHKTSSTKKILIISTVVLVVLLLLGYGYFYGLKATLFGWSPVQPEQSQNTSGNNPPSDEQVKNGQSIKEQSVESGGSSGSDQPASLTPSQNGKSVVDIAFTATNQTASQLQLRTLVYGIGTNGVCTLTLSKAGSATVTKTASTQNLSNTSTCTGFDIALSELSSGTWQASLSYESDSLQGSTSKSIVVN